MEEERICLFLDFENLAIGAREQLGANFDFKPIADALAERGRVVVRRAYADWSSFGDAGRDLTRHHIELIEIPQRMGTVRKNAADIKLAVDAIELCYEREYITTFVIGTGDSDFTPLVHKLRELNKRVIGIGVGAATSSLLPPACDEFLFYERLQGVDLTTPLRPRNSRSTSRRRPAGPAKGREKEKEKTPEPETETAEEVAPRPTDVEALGVLVTQTLSGLKRRSSDVVLGSMLKRTLLRKDPTFDEADYGFRSLGEMLRHFAERRVIELKDGSAPGDPEVDFPQGTSGDDEAFELLRTVVSELGSAQLRGLKNEVRKRQPDFTEKKYGYGGFLQFCKAAQAQGYVEMDLDEAAETYVLRAGNGAKPEATEPPAAETPTTDAPAAETPTTDAPAAETPDADAPEEPAAKPKRSKAKAAGDRVVSRTRVRRKAKPAE